MPAAPALAWRPAYNGPMIAREPTIARLATAQSLLLDPFGLTPTHLQRALGILELAMRRDDDDLAVLWNK